MKISFLIIVFVSRQFIVVAYDNNPTKSVQERVQRLKDKISQQIRLQPLSDELYEYVDKPKVTPISEKDNRKFSNRFKLREIKTTQMPQIIPTTPIIKTIPIARMNNRKRKAKKSRIMEPLDVFYRRSLSKISNYSAHCNWVHCQELVTPFLTNAKKDWSTPKLLHHTAEPVVRLIKLFNTNVTGFMEEDIVAVLYQISSIKIRLFQWDVPAMGLLLKAVVSPAIKQSFKTLKRGVKSLFERWGMIFEDTEILLKQSRMYRPPCIEISKYEGSTKSAGIHKITRKTTDRCNKNEPGCVLG